MERFNNRIRAVQITNNVFKRYDSCNGFEVFWHNLSYNPTVIGWMSSTRKLIINGLNGYFKSGELVAVMGPSGAGKSTLLEIIAGTRISGVNGEVRVRGIDEIKVGFVPQDNCLMEFLTVKETFVFASKLLNTESIDFYHNIIADKLIVRFGLEACAHTYTHRCSGGQQKRISIALEVLSSPKLLILDEPTTGLDSHSCSHVMNILQQLVSNQTNPMAIVVTIHQPSVPIFNRFNRVYTLTRNGKCLYNGNPSKLIQTLLKVGLMCDSYTSPADYLIEIASGDYGLEPITRLCNETNSSPDMNRWITWNSKILAKATKHVSHPFGEHLKILLNRSHLMLYRNPFLTFIRIFVVIFLAIFMSLLFGKKAGKVSGCVPRVLEVFVIPIDVLTYKLVDDVKMILQNVSLLVNGVMVVFVAGIGPSLLIFLKEMQTLRKEYNNGWYSSLTYYLAKSVSDLPLQIITPILYITITYVYTEQPLEMFRFFAIIFISIVSTLLAQSFGEFLSVVWMDRPLMAAFVGELSPFPMLILSGILLKISRMPFYLRPLTWFSFIRFSIEANLISIYGFNRCLYNYNRFLSTTNVSAVTKPNWVIALQAMQEFLDEDQKDEDYSEDEIALREKDEMSLKQAYGFFMSNSVKGDGDIDFDRSLFLGYMEINENNLYQSFAILTAYLFAFKVCTYFVLKYKLNSSK